VCRKTYANEGQGQMFSGNAIKKYWTTASIPNLLVRCGDVRRFFLIQVFKDAHDEQQTN
jgi:hypothetical protein